MKYKIVKKDGLFLIQSFSYVAQKFITLAEHSSLNRAKLDLEMWRAS